jgi:hypothetical protein
MSSNRIPAEHRYRPETIAEMCAAIWELNNHGLKPRDIAAALQIDVNQVNRVLEGNHE